MTSRRVRLGGMAPSAMVDDVPDELDDAAETDEPEPRYTPPPPTPGVPPANLNNAVEIASNTKQARNHEAEEDRALIALAQNGDKAAFRKLIERHQRRAFAVAVGLVRDENDAKELVQEAFVRVFKSLATFQGGSSFFTWLYRIITNLSIDLIRRPSRQIAEADVRELDENREPDFPLVSRIEGDDPADVVRRSEIAVKLRDALEALPEYHRAVIVMREVDGMSYDEIAEALEVSKGTVMSRLFHARQKLQRALADVYREQVGVLPKEETEVPS
jgi:RNA polymerase sigma-70 factor, ECF subfamily